MYSVKNRPQKYWHEHVEMLHIVLCPLSYLYKALMYSLETWHDMHSPSACFNYGV